MCLLNLTMLLKQQLMNKELKLMKEFKKNKADLIYQKVNHNQILMIKHKMKSHKMKLNQDMKKFLKIQDLLKMKRNHFGQNFFKVIINNRKSKIMMMMLFCLKLWMFLMAKKLLMMFYMNKIIKWHSNYINKMKFPMKRNSSLLQKS